MLQLLVACQHDWSNHWMLVTMLPVSNRYVSNVTLHKA
jgi:hypothetical protein